MPKTNGAATADKLRGLADGLQRAIDDKLSNHRQTNTPKRQREAQSARLEGGRLERTQQALRALAGLHGAGTVPPELEGVTSKAEAYNLCRSVIKSGGGYYDAGYDTGEPAVTTPAAVALWALLKGPSEADKHAEALRQAMDKIQFSNIPGYFPTPAGLVGRMIEAANIPNWASAGAGCRILEPSAGSGAILDGLKKECGNALLHAYERHMSLRNILDLKGYTIWGDDFTEAEPTANYDRVLMNPPFENGQDIEHVRRAFGFLKSGGRLVAIMSPGPFYHNNRRAQDFRDWFEALDGIREDIAAGTFKESGTGVASVMVVIDAPEKAANIDRTDQGDQYVMPGAERTATQAAAARGEMKTSRKPQQPANIGLFASADQHEPAFF